MGNRGNLQVPPDPVLRHPQVFLHPGRITEFRPIGGDTMMTENEKKALSSVFSAVNKALTVADESTIMAMTYAYAAGKAAAQKEQAEKSA